MNDERSARRGSHHPTQDGNPQPAGRVALRARSVRRRRKESGTSDRDSLNRARTLGRARRRARGSSRRLRLGYAGRDQPGARSDVVPRDHPVIDTEHHVVQGQIIVDGRRQTFELEPPVVRQIAGRTALKWRQTGDRRRREGRQEPRTAASGSLATTRRTPLAGSIHSVRDPRLRTTATGSAVRNEYRPSRRHAARCRATVGTASRQAVRNCEPDPEAARAPRRAEGRGADIRLWALGSGSGFFTWL